MISPQTRIALHSEVREGYGHAHARIPDDLVMAFARVGIHEWTIWRSGRHAFHLVICDDWDAAVAALEDEPANVAWQQTIGPYVELYRDTDGAPGFAPLEVVWDLATQRKGGS
jgi:L-rhamnose mutarotase